MALNDVFDWVRGKKDERSEVSMRSTRQKDDLCLSQAEKAQWLSDGN